MSYVVRIGGGGGGACRNGVRRRRKHSVEDHDLFIGGSRWLMFGAVVVPGIFLFSRVVCGCLGAWVLDPWRGAWVWVWVCGRVQCAFVFVVYAQ